ncbi:unnamed protein product [Echinostoma caproni]|uniref:BCAS3 domain-containing protein n=1 Tax=Echinostoma caproni TaxID=27848 RepID=A0A183AYG4_9TREM|nr:unnamed protein product [Echinostoma caproni]
MTTVFLSIFYLASDSFCIDIHRSGKSGPDSGAHHYPRHRTTSSGSTASQGGTPGYGPTLDELESGSGAGSTLGTDETIVGPTSTDRGSPHTGSDMSGQSSGGSWSSGLMGWMGSTLKAYSSYLPHQVSEIFAQDRAFAYCHLPTNHGGLFWSGAGRGSPVGAAAVGGDGSAGGTHGIQPGVPQNLGLHKVAAVVFYQNQPRLIVAGLDGFVHTFAIDPVNGGEATLLRTQRLLSPNPQSGSGSRPLGQGTGSPSHSPGEDDSTIAGPQLTGGPHHPGVYITPAPRTPTNVAAGSTTTSGRAATFAAAVATGTSPTEGTDARF